MKKTATGKNVNILTGNVNLESQLISIQGLNHIVASILSKNKSISIENIEDFINPKLKNLLCDPKNLLMIDDAIENICNSIIENQKIGILGDYDVDGVSSSAMMKIFLKSLNVDPYIIIPDRFKDGYGPSVSLFDRMHKEKINTIITLDCGTVAFEPIEHAVNLGMKVIVIDHHISQEKKPKAAAIVNPNQIGDKSDLGYMCAAGVTFMLCIGISSELKNRGFFKDKDPANLMNLVPLAMLGSVCDMMKMIKINRAFFKTGIDVLAKNIKNFENLDKNAKMSTIGIRALMKIANLESIKTTFDLGFIIGPMINAGGRLESGMIGVDLLTSEDENEALKLAEKLLKTNQERKDIQSDILEDATKQAERLIKSGKNILFLISENYNEGVVGIVASKIKEAFGKTTIIGAIKNTDIKIIKASCRSVDGVDIGSAVISALESGIILKGGGHIAAAGFSAKFENYEKLYDFFEKEMMEQSENAKLNAKIDIHKVISQSELNENLIEIKKLEPFGFENPKPNFLIKNAILLDFKAIKEIHYRLIFKETNQNKINNAMFFNCKGSEIENFIKKNIGKEVDIICNIDFNSYGMSIIGIDIA